MSRLSKIFPHFDHTLFFLFFKIKDKNISTRTILINIQKFKIKQKLNKMKVVSGIISSIPITCKVIYVVSTILYIIGIIISAVPLFLANYPELIFQKLQLWRLFLTFFSKGDSVLSIPSIIIDFLMIRFVFGKLEQKYSTVYFATQLFLMNFIFQVFFTLVAVIFLYFDFLESFLISYGWSPLIVIFVFKYAFKTDEPKLKVFCFEIQKKHIPFIIIALSLIFAFQQFLCILFAIVFGYIQYGMYGKNFISCSLGCYKKVESCLPQKLKNREDFKRIQGLETNIEEHCKKAEENVPELKQAKSENPPVVSQELKLQEKKVRKQRKTGRNKNNTSSTSNHSSNNSYDMKDQIQSGKETKGGNTDDVEQLPNLDTDNNLQKTDIKL